jgi:hypothetical protein
MNINPDILDTLKYIISEELTILVIAAADAHPADYLELSASVETHTLRELLIGIDSDRTLVEEQCKLIPTIRHNILSNRLDLLLSLDFDYIADAVRQTMVDSYYKNIM